MQRVLVALIVVVVATSVMAGSPANVEKQRQLTVQGEPGEFTIAGDAVLTDSYSGELSATSPL